MRYTLIALGLLLLPASVSAASPVASFSVARDLVASSTVPGNAYVGGSTVVVTAPTVGDLTAFGGAVTAAGATGGDALFLGGSVSSRAPVGGDMRAVAGTVNVIEGVRGDLVALGYRVDVTARPVGTVFIGAANATLAAGAGGPVTIYANNVLLGGEFAQDVTVVAGGTVTLAKDTVIRGKLHYEAPDAARIPESAVVRGGVEYVSASYLPDAGTSRVLAVASIGLFLLIRIIGALLLAGLVAGLFPEPARRIAQRASGSTRTFFLTTLLGFAALVATPVMLILLALTFVGIGMAAVGAVGYLLLVIMSFVYAGILLGTLFVRRFRHRESILWHDGVLGMLLLSVLGLVPALGALVVLVVVSFTAGALLSLFFSFAFPHEEGDEA